MIIIKWTNKYSGETGYVEDVNKKEKHFINTYEQSQARKYNNAGNARRVIESLTSYGEADNNDFELITV